MQILGHNWMQSNSRVAQKQLFNRLYIQKKDNYDDINDYFRKILKNNSEDIINVFQNIGVNYCNNISIQDNFMNAFIVLETGIVNFSKEKYLQLNPDVKAAGVNPYQHYLEFGIAERRRIQ